MNVELARTLPPRVLFGPQRPVDTGAGAPPRFTTLLLLAALAVLLQVTFGHAWTLRGAHISFLTVLVVWTGLRCGPTTGGWLGLLGGALEDALGGGGASVLAMTIVGFLSGLLSSRFFADSLTAVVASVAGGTIARNAITYAVLEVAYGDRGSYHRIAHATAWEVVLNCALSVLVVLALRWWSDRRPASA
jgi:rod shape-determining protein MreD